MAARCGDAARVCSVAESAAFYQVRLPRSPLNVRFSIGWDSTTRSIAKATTRTKLLVPAATKVRRKKPVDEAQDQGFFQFDARSQVEAPLGAPAVEEDESQELDLTAQAEAIASSLDRNGVVETVRFLDGASLSPILVGPVLKRTKRCEAALEFFQWCRQQDGFKHSLYNYNSMLASMVVSKSVALEKIYSQMLEDGVVPDRDSYNLLVRGLTKLSSVDQARAMLSTMVGEGYDPDVVTCGLLVDKFCEMKRVGEVCELFQELESNGVAVGMLAYNAILKALMCSGDFDGGFKFSDIAVGDGSLPHVLAYKTMLDCLIKTGKTREASEVVGEMIKKSVPDGMTYTALISVLCKHNRADDAMKVFDIMVEKEIVPNLDVYTSLLAAHCRTRKLDGAYRLFVEMIQRGYGPSASTYGLLLRCLCNGGRSYLAYDIHSSMRSRGHVPDENTYASLIYGCCMAGRITEAKVLFKEVLEGEKALLDAGIYNVLIEGLCRASKVEEALEVTAGMVDKGCIPTLQTYNALIMGFFKANEVDKALQLFRVMEEKGFSPNTMIYSTFIDGLCKVGKINEAHEFFQQSVERGCVPDNVTYNALIRGLFGANRMDEAHRLYREMGERGYIADRSLRTLAFQRSREEQSFHS
ncbi:pentatricopeptide repeat-containing protein At1g62720 [Selaginella moellendorffii]|nr:pentatricopeptide repeat-containing protein At1g62720 [Selaginella moellendorffii]|eukprot:XP_002982495.2 pentatricopeptide repeat-containing protein At1g62720 [Selaginella moellendorffii]